MKFSLDDVGVKESVVTSLGSKPPLLTSESITPSTTPKVIKRIIFTRTEITIYPNGQMYQKTTSWLDKQTYQVKKKVKKKSAPVKKTIKKKEESY